MRFEVHLSTDNAAFWSGLDADTFEPGPEVARILRELADRVEDAVAAEQPIRLSDGNGNRVGYAVLTAGGTTP